MQGRAAVLVTDAAHALESAQQLGALGASRVISIDSAATDVCARAEAALLTAMATEPAKPGKREPSELLLNAARACSVEWPDVLGALDAPIRMRAEQVGSTVEAVSSAFLAAISGCLTGRIKFQARDRFTAAPVLWFGLVEPPGAGKSQAGDTIFNRIIELQAQDFQRIKALKAAGAEDAGVPRRALVKDATIEAVQGIAAAQERGLVLHHDELAGFFSAMSRYKSDSRPKWLSAFEGAPDYIDRKSLPEPLFVPCWGVSLWGGIQPDRLAGLRDLELDDGLGARFIWLRPTPAPVLERPKSLGQTDLIDQVIERAFRLRTQAIGTAELVSMDPPALARFEAARFRILSRARNDGSLDSWVSKLPGLILRVSGMLSVIDALAEDRHPKTIGLDHVERAIKLVDVFTAHRRKVLVELGTPPVERMAAELAGWIVRHKVSRLSTFEIRRGLIPGIRTADNLRKALVELQEAGWLDSRTVISPKANELLPPVVNVAQGVNAFFQTPHH